MSNPDVVVVGAGYAGLAAALDLESAGLSVVVLDGDGRVGGRARSIRLENGALAELGGEWIFEGYDALEELAARFGLELVPTGVDFARREPRGDAVSLREQDAYLRSATEALAAIGPKERERRSLAEFLAGLRGRASAAATVAARLRGTCAVPLHEVSLATAEDLLRPEGAGPTRRFAEGAQALAEVMAGRLADVRLGVPVAAVEHDRAGVGVRPRGAADVIEARAAVIAVPLPVLRSLPIDPPPPPEVAEALDALAMGTASKLAFALGHVPEPATRQCVDPPFWWWTALGEGGRVRECVTSLAPAPSTNEELTAGDGWLGHLLALDPTLRFEGEAVFVAWGSDPSSAGAYSAIPPGAPPLLSALAPPFGRVALAGEHTAGVRWHGTLEGALRSGQRAAAAVRRMLDEG